MKREANHEPSTRRDAHPKRMMLVKLASPRLIEMTNTPLESGRDNADRLRRLEAHAPVLHGEE
jgi:hypothetical protein